MITLTLTLTGNGNIRNWRREEMRCRGRGSGSGFAQHLIISRESRPSVQAAIILFSVSPSAVSANASGPTRPTR